MKSRRRTPKKPKRRGLEGVLRAVPLTTRCGLSATNGAGHTSACYWPDYAAMARAARGYFAYSQKLASRAKRVRP